MSTDFARVRDGPNTILTPSIFDFRVDCPREIDFDFFDAAPSSPLSFAPWEARQDTTSKSHENESLQSSPSPQPATDESNEESDVVAYVPQLKSSNRQSAPSGVVPDISGSNHDAPEDAPPDIKSDQTDTGIHRDASADRKSLHGSIIQEQNHDEDVVAGKADNSALIPNHDRGGEEKEQSSEPERHIRELVQDPPDPDMGAGSGSSPPCNVKGETEEAPLGVTDLVMVPKYSLCKSRLGLASASSSMTGVSSVPDGPSGGSSDESSGEDAEEVGVTIVTGALRSLRPPSSTRSYASSTLSKRSQSGRINMSFSNDETRRIQRENEILLRRIVAQKARVPPCSQPPPSARSAPPSARPCSHAINRVRRSKDIQRENEILLKKIQAVKRSSGQLFMSSRSSSALSGRV